MDQLPGKCLDAATNLIGSVVQEHATPLFKLEENLTSLKRKRDQLENIHKDVLIRIDAESIGEMQRTNEVNGWLQQFQNLQLEMNEIDAEGSQEIQNMPQRYKLGKKVVKVIAEVDELVTSGRRFVDKNVNIAYKLPPKLVDEMPCVETVGLEVMLNKVWNSLKDENVGIIGLYGMGGAGKTTLLKRIHNELGRREHGFDLVLWVVVSRDCNIDKIMNDIRHRLGLRDSDWDQRSEDQRVATIFHVLKRKRFVLMLDDLWGKLELERVGVPHPKETNYQSKVVLTTRTEDVCDKMQAQKKFKVEVLLEKEAFDLFCKKVGEETLKCHTAIPKLAREIAKACKGLPLALTTVGSAMAGVKSVEAWRQAKSDLSSSPWIAPDLEEKVFCTLKFSYDRLPDEAHKSCLLYCALYPEDSLVQVEDLIDRWIGEGFLGKGKCKSKKSIYDMREEGHSIIEKLKLSCLLEDATCQYENWKPVIKMHDVIRDMTLWLSRDQDANKGKVVVEEQAFEMNSEILNLVERISIIDVKETWQVPACPNLFTLCAQGSRDITDFSNLQYMTRLKVLDLSRNWHIQHLPFEIGKLINLEFLNLSNTDIQYRLPVELKNLKKLRVFLMENANVIMFPLEVLESLVRLKVFRHYGRSSGQEQEAILLDKLECLPELEELSIRLRTKTGMHKLLNSTKLQGCLRHLRLNGFMEQLQIEMESLLASWSEMKHLEGISLRCVDGIKEISSVTYTCSLSMLRKVEISYCGSITHLTWLRYAPHLELLEVQNCYSMEELVKEGQYEDEDVGIELFSNLRVLSLCWLPKLKSIHKRALPFPFLRSIKIESCNNLRKLPMNSNSAKDSLIQILGDPQWWSNLEWEDPATKHLLHSKFQPHQNI